MYESQIVQTNRGPEVAVLKTVGRTHPICDNGIENDKITCFVIEIRSKSR